MLVGGGVINSDRTINATSATASVPSGSIYIGPDDSKRFTVPNGIKVLYVRGFCVGVTPGSTHIWELQTDFIPPHHTMEYSIFCYTHRRHHIVDWEIEGVNDEDDKEGVTISWSPSINNRTPDYTDY